MKELVKWWELTIAELADLHNSINPDAPVKRFASKRKGVARIQKLMDELEKKKGSTKPAKAPIDRSTAIANTWHNAATRELRSQRHHVWIKGVGEFRSVKQAFEKIGLPLNEHIKFRMDLKKHGELASYGYTWKIIEV